MIGLCLNEVGNLDDLLTDEDKNKMTSLLQQAFHEARLGMCRVIWPRRGGETVSAWKHNIEVTELEPMANFVGGS